MADDPTSDALREANDPTTSAARLQELAQVDRATWPAIAAHPAAYPGLLDWLGEHGDDDVRAAIAARGTGAAATAEQAAVTQQIDATQQIDPDATQQIDPTPTTVSPAVAAAAPAAAVPSAAAGTPPPTDDEPSTRTRNGLLIALGVVVLLVVGGLVGAQALSGDDDGSDRPVASSEASEPTAAPDSPGGDDSDEPDAPPPGSDDDVEDFCESFEDVQQSGAGVNGVDGGSGTPDLSQLQDSLDDVADSYEDLADDAPPEIKNEAAVLRDFFTAITDASENPDGGAPFGDGDPSEYIAAAAAVSQYYAANCG